MLKTVAVAVLELENIDTEGVVNPSLLRSSKLSFLNI
jgi:hypothetical protein